MKTIVSNLWAAISNKKATALTLRASESPAYEIGKTKTFTAAELWNIQRQKRNTLQRRYFA